MRVSTKEETHTTAEVTGRNVARGVVNRGALKKTAMVDGKHDLPTFYLAASFIEREAQMATTPTFFPECLKLF